ncbi:MAG: ABC transporter ATP-binding protein/permease [Lachnospiraceae bacterium]|nr:ABC transporter ATP-binding protein/permease [Lachnospiraceae bacterium]
MASDNKSEKKLQSKQVIKRALLFLRPYRGMFILAMIAGTLASVLNVIIPDRIRKIADIIEAGLDTGIDTKEVVSKGIIGGIIVLLYFLFNLFFTRRMEMIGQSVSRDIRGALNDKLNKTAMSEFDNVSAGELISRMGTDVDNVCMAVSRAVGPLFSNAVLLAGSLILMFTSSVWLAVCVLLSIFVGGFISMLITFKAMPVQSAQRNELALINLSIDEALSGHTVIKSFNAEDDVLSVFHARNDAMTKNAQKSQFVTGILTPLMNYINNLTYVVICFAGAYMMLKGMGNVTIGVIVAFILYSKTLSTPVSYFAGVMGQITQGIVSADRIFDTLDMPEEINEGKIKPASVKGEVIFDNVRFGYVKEKEIIHGFSATVKPGQKVAIVGPTGAGKSTLVNLLMRFYETDSGDIKIDGVSVKDMERKALHEILGMVLQETFLFSGSIRDNITCGATDVTEDKIMDVVEKCGLSYLVRTLPDGIDTVLNEASNVSAGQKQLITIARTMLRDPDILILDEATSSVDTRTEILIQKALDTLSEGRTSFVIAHRLSTIQNADLIFVLCDGDIVETGTHTELLEKGGLYGELYRSQFEV